eukprot:4020443-Pleurochrysis_carterae.AAC.1
MKKKAERVAVITARRPCVMAMPSEGCAAAMALSTGGSVPVLISSQKSSVQEACALAGGGMTPKRSACQ